MNFYVFSGKTGFFGYLNFGKIFFSKKVYYGANVYQKLSWHEFFYGHRSISHNCCLYTRGDFYSKSIFSTYFCVVLRQVTGAHSRRIRLNIFCVPPARHLERVCLLARWCTLYSIVVLRHMNPARERDPAINGFFFAFPFLSFYLQAENKLTNINLLHSHRRHFQLKLDKKMSRSNLNSTPDRAA